MIGIMAVMALVRPLPNFSYLLYGVRQRVNGIHSLFSVCVRFASDCLTRGLLCASATGHVD